MRQVTPGNSGRRSWTANCLDRGRRHLLRLEVQEARAGPAGSAGGRGKEGGGREWLMGVFQALPFGTRLWGHGNGRVEEGPAGAEDDNKKKLLKNYFYTIRDQFSLDR